MEEVTTGQPIGDQVDAPGSSSAPHDDRGAATATSKRTATPVAVPEAPAPGRTPPPNGGGAGPEPTAEGGGEGGAPAGQDGGDTTGEAVRTGQNRRRRGSRGGRGRR